MSAQGHWFGAVYRVRTLARLALELEELFEPETVLANGFLQGCTVDLEGEIELLGQRVRTFIPSSERVEIEAKLARLNGTPLGEALYAVAKLDPAQLAAAGEAFKPETELLVRLRHLLLHGETLKEGGQG